MEMVVLGIAMECKDGKMTLIHTEIPFQNFDGFIALRLRRLLAFLPAQQPMIDGVSAASRFDC